LSGWACAYKVRKSGMVPSFLPQPRQRKTHYHDIP
jgi:hypothetical protein